MSLFLAFTYCQESLDDGSVWTSGKREKTAGYHRDTMRLCEYLSEDASAIAVSSAFSHINGGSARYLNSDFTGRGFLKDVDRHVSLHQMTKIINEVILDYLWMPRGWDYEKYGANNFKLLEHILHLGQRTHESVHLRVGGIVYLPTSEGFYKGMVESRHWEELQAVYRVEYIKKGEANHHPLKGEANHHPLVTSDIRIQSSIEEYGNNLDEAISTFVTLTRKA